MSKPDPISIRTLTVTSECFEVIRSMANNLRQTGVRTPDGSWSIPVDDEIADFLDANSLPGESVSDTIIRYARASLGSKPS